MSEPPCPSEIPPALRVGELFDGRYRLKELLGRGGTGAVYLADEVVRRGQVALKILDRGLLSDEDAIARFEREAGTLAALTHENIVRPLDFGQSADGEIYLAMEIADGDGLDALSYARAGLSSEQVVAIVRQLGSALTEAHALDMVHRDLKPDNVRVKLLPDGGARVKLLDLGLARVARWHASGATPISRPWMVFGTPAYMAPEQALGRAVDGRADQYSLGVMLYELLVGRRPFDDPDPIELVQRHATQPVVPPRVARAAVSAELSAVVCRMLAKQPDDRYPSIAAATAEFIAAAERAPGLRYGARMRFARPPAMDTLPDVSTAAALPLVAHAPAIDVGHAAPARREPRSAFARAALLAVLLVVAALVAVAWSRAR